MGSSLGKALRQALLTPQPIAKVMATRALVRQWRRGELAFTFDVPMPDQPAWPASLELLSPGQMPRRASGGADRTRIALWHAIAHIEFVAIDLALDMAGRFGAEMGTQFVDDFLSVAADEAMHFALAERKLRSMGAHYTCLPAHNGLWDAASATRHDVAARLAVVPMVLEARALDVTPATLERVRSTGDRGGARILKRILDDEIRHVRAGATHFNAWCQNNAVEPESHWKTLVARHFHGAIKPPFNDSARLAAGLSRDWYTAVA